MKTIKMGLFQGLKRGLLILFILAVTVANAANATVYFSMNAGADGGNDTVQGGIVYDNDGTTRLDGTDASGNASSTGCLVQYIRVGANHAKNDADQSNVNYIGGDDVLVSSKVVGNDSVWLAFANQDGMFYHTASGSFTGTDTLAANIYIRIWNRDTIANSTHYVDSAILTPSTSTVAPPTANDIGTGNLTCNIIKPAPGTITITSSSLPNGTVGVAYSATLQATGGTTPYTWSVSGTLPAGLSLNSGTGTITGTPTTAGGPTTLTFQVTGGGTATRALTITINPPASTDPTISGITPSTAAIGQTIVIAGSNLGTSGTVTIGGVTAVPTDWTSSAIVVAVPAGVAQGTAAVVVSTGGKTANGSLTVSNGSINTIYIDDYEGGCVGDWNPLAAGGYYRFGTGESFDGTVNTDADINGVAIVAAAAREGAKGFKVRYTYTAPSEYAGWGAQLASQRDLTSANYVSFWLNWDGSINDVKLSLQDADGTAYAAAIPNTRLTGSGWHRVIVAKSEFAADPTGNRAGANTSFDWNKIANYNFVYTTRGTTTNYQLIDSLIASTGTPTDEPHVVTGEAVISVSPEAAPVGARITISHVSGKTFGSFQGRSKVVFTNRATSASEDQVTVISWADTAIEAIVPNLAAGSYDISVYVAPSASGLDAFTTNPDEFRISAASGGDIATVYPNPFNPNAEVVTIVVNNTAGATNLGVYIFDMTAHQVAKQVLTGTNQTTWDGKDYSGSVVGDGAYILRVVNEDTKSLLAKGKILVVKR